MTLLCELLKLHDYNRKQIINTLSQLFFLKLSKAHARQDQNKLV